MYLTVVSSFSIKEFTELHLGKERLWISRNLPVSFFSMHTRGEQTKFLNGGVSNGPTIRCNSISFCNIKSTTSEFFPALGWFELSILSAGPLKPILKPSVKPDTKYSIFSVGYPLSRFLKAATFKFERVFPLLPSSVVAETTRVWSFACCAYVFVRTRLTIWPSKDARTSRILWPALYFLVLLALYEHSILNLAKFIFYAFKLRTQLLSNM